MGPTKTHEARKIALDVVTLAVIDTHRQRAEGWAVDAGVAIHCDGYILTEDPTGRTPLAPDTLTHRFSRLVLQTGVGPLRFHDLRHSVATTLLAAGYDLAVVAGRLGHRDPTITLRVYAQPWSSQIAKRRTLSERCWLRGGRGSYRVDGIVPTC